MGDAAARGYLYVLTMADVLIIVPPTTPPTRLPVPRPMPMTKFCIGRVMRGG